jgi:hypothetical protein
MGGGKPWVCEVHFAFDEELNLYFRSLRSRRHSQEIAKKPEVAGNICPQYGLEEGCGGAISFEGSCKMVADPAKLKQIFPFFAKKLGSTEKILEEAKDAEGHQFYKITIKNWYAYGKFGGVSAEKYCLSLN